MTTFPPANIYNEVVLALGSCQYKAKYSQALAEIASRRQAVNPKAAFLMLHIGDLHYGDIGQNDPSLFEQAIRNVITTYDASALFRTVPVAYCWDDHDYGANNSNSDSPSRSAALQAYNAMVPSPSEHGLVYHAFTVARVRIIMTDLRSEAEPARGVAMSESQLNFLLGELGAWGGYDCMVWASSRPWIEDESKGSDRWGGFAPQRKIIANFIAEQGIDNLVIVSGDAHMLAFDDGSNSCYADEKYGAGGFPVLHAAPLANVGTKKGGPYSGGVVTRRLRKTKQYAMLRIWKEGGKTRIEFNGYRVRAVERQKELGNKKAVISYAAERPLLKKGGEKGEENCDGGLKLVDWISNKFS